MSFLYFRETTAWIVVLGAFKEFLDPDVDKQADLARASSQWLEWMRRRAGRAV